MAAPQIISFTDFSITQPSGGANIVGGYLTDETARAAACTNPQFGGTGARTRTGSSGVTVTSPIGSFTRSLSINLCSGLAPLSSQIGVNVNGRGLLEIINNPGEISVGAIRYGLGSTDQFADEKAAYAAANGGLDQLGFAFDVVSSDANAINVRAVLNAGRPNQVALAAEEIGRNFAGRFIFLFDPMVSLTGTLDFIFTGAQGYDLAVRQFGLYLNNSQAVPAPAAAALVGLGVAGVALSRRRAR